MEGSRLVLLIRLIGGGLSELENASATGEKPLSSFFICSPCSALPMLSKL
jgi:hypothetical protein